MKRQAELADKSTRAGYVLCVSSVIPVRSTVHIRSVSVLLAAVNKETCQVAIGVLLHISYTTDVMGVGLFDEKMANAESFLREYSCKKSKVQEQR